MLISSHKWPVSFQRDLYLRDVEARLLPRTTMLSDVALSRREHRKKYWKYVVHTSLRPSRPGEISRLLYVCLRKLAFTLEHFLRRLPNCVACHLCPPAHRWILDSGFVCWGRKCFFKIKIYALTLKYKFNKIHKF